MFKCFVRECHQRKTTARETGAPYPKCSDLGFGCDPVGKAKKHDMTIAHHCQLSSGFKFFSCTNGFYNMASAWHHCHQIEQNLKCSLMLAAANPPPPCVPVIESAACAGHCLSSSKRAPT
jgi:hypothetical protein